MLKSFTGTNGDGEFPLESLLQASDGVLYGVTETGGIDNGGTVFRLNPDGTGYQILRRFTDATGEGKNPAGSLVQKADGILCGVTIAGGASVNGTVFQLNCDGSGFAVLHAFTDGAGLNLLQTSDGKLFGSTWRSGTMPYGSLFSLEPGAVLLPLTVSAQGFRVRLTGSPDRSYVLHRATSLAGPWTTITTVTADSMGNVTYDDDSSALSETRFYRTVHP